MSEELLEKLSKLTPDTILSPEQVKEGYEVLKEFAEARQRAAFKARNIFLR